MGNVPYATDYENYRDAGNGIKVPYVIHIVGPSRPLWMGGRLSKWTPTEYIWVYVDGRGSNGYSGMGELDILEVMKDEVQQELLVLDYTKPSIS